MVLTYLAHYVADAVLNPGLAHDATLLLGVFMACIIGRCCNTCVPKVERAKSHDGA